jgi:NTP pyrophosphatase (non-canonical NTP hydrolase)
MVRKSISDWQKEAHALAVEKGWYEGVTDNLSPTRIGSRLALIHGEISEALDCVSKGRMSFFWLGLKPEGFPVELADVFLRLCDFAESVGVQMDEPSGLSVWHLDTPESVAAELNSLHTSLAAVSWTGPETLVDDYALNGLLEQLFGLARSKKIDLLAMAEIKHTYNKTRPHKHGKVL